jgi:putative DNA primase/helicase
MTKQSPDALVILSPATPQVSAEKFKQLTSPTLINHQGEWLAHDGAAYQPIENETIEAQISQFLGAAKVKGVEKVTGEDGETINKPATFPFNPKKSHIAEVVEMLRHDCHVPHNTMSPPVWLKDTPPEYAAINPKNLISFKNGLLNIETRELYAATPFFFTRTALAMDYDADAPAPEQWLAFLAEVTNGRPALASLIQEMLGYLISTDTSMHKVFFMWGRPRSGKGTILRITTALVGKHNTRFPTIETLAGRFGLQGLIGSSVAQVTDMNADSKQDLGRAASRINGISGEDGQTVERKGVTDWNGVISARFVLAGNTLPNLGTHTGAMATRLLIVPFDVSFEGREDRSLTDKLMAELPGILNWALDGLDFLRLMGDFDEPSDSKAAKLRLVYLSDPIHGFVEERCTVSADAGVDKAVLYDAYVRYCNEVGAHPQPLHQFTERLVQIYPSVAASRRRVGNDRPPTYSGIRLSDAEAAKTYVVDHGLLSLGFEPWEALQCDASGWPVPRDGSASDFASAP